MKKRLFIVLVLIAIIAIFLPLSFAEDIYIDITEDLGAAKTQDTVSESIYVDIEEVSNLVAYTTNLTLLEHIPGEIAEWSQQITLQSLSNNSAVHVLNVWRDSKLSDAFLNEATYVSTYNGQTYDSNSFIVEIPAQRSVTVDVRFTTPGINSSKRCYEQTIQDLLPADAEIILSDLDITTVISQVCEFTLSSAHDYFKGTNLMVTDIDKSAISNIVYE